MTRSEQDGNIEQVKTWIKMLAEVQGTPPEGYKNTPASLLVKYGRPYYIDDETFKGTREESKMCYMNAWRLAMGCPELTYVEGYCHMGVIPIEHAWCVTENGTVIDTTLKDAVGYFGIPFDTEYMAKATLKKGTYGLLHFDNREIYKLEPEHFLSGICTKEEVKDGT